MDSALDLSDANTVLFHLIERAQFPLNATIYQPGAIPIATTDTTSSSNTHENSISPLSFSDWVLREQEKLQSQIRRFQSPDEHPFFPDAMQPLILPPLKYPQILWPNTVNVNPELKQRYVESILPTCCFKPTRAERATEAQENYGSSATADVNCLQSLSRRIHFGKFVAESKFQSSPSTFVPLIKAGDRAGIDAAITDSKVELKVLDRLRKKAEMYGVDPTMGANSNAKEDESNKVSKINVDAVVAMYRDHVIPLTKVVEVEYLMERLKGTEWE